MANGIGAVVCATAYACDFGWIDLPVLDPRGMPIHRCGVSAEHGLYFLGLQWLCRMKSSFMAGVGEDAEHLAEHILGTVAGKVPGSARRSNAAA